MKSIAAAVWLIFIACAFTRGGSIIFPVSPAYSNRSQNALQRLRQNVTVTKSTDTGTSLTNCGILWVLTSVNGSTTDMASLTADGNGEGLFRMMAVAYEVFQSAARVKHAFQLNNSIPSVCTGTIQLTLYTDRIIFDSELGRELKILEDANCIFDRITYFDQLNVDAALAALSISTTSVNTAGRVQRLPSRANYMKIISLLTTPFQYTLYLDGDTAPCVGFQQEAFGHLANNDIFTTVNTFGHESTAGKPLYTGSPKHPSFKSFVEPNGGVIGFRWNERTERFLIRSLELVPHFHSLGFDQDQAYLRHALFEEVHLHGLQQTIIPMRKMCRFGWRCELNSCETGCLIIHQRLCLTNGVSANFTTSLSAPHKLCARAVLNAIQRVPSFTRKYQQARKLNKASGLKTGMKGKGEIKRKKPKLELLTL